LGGRTAEAAREFFNAYLSLNCKFTAEYYQRKTFKIVFDAVMTKTWWGVTFYCATLYVCMCKLCVVIKE